MKFKPFTDRLAAESFATIVQRIPARELAEAADRTVESAKGWRKGRSCPSAASLINMARTLPEVHAWLIAQIGGGR